MSANARRRLEVRTPSTAIYLQDSRCARKILLARYGRVSPLSFTTGQKATPDRQLALSQTRTFAMETQDSAEFQFHPVSPQRLPDLAAFSLCHGKFRYCSCMRWRMTSAEFRRSSKEQRIAALEALAGTGAPVGVLAYHEGEPVAWCSVAPRESYAALERSRSLPRIDGAAVWAVTCFFVDRRFRRQGLTCALLKAAVDYARSQNAAIVEGYPVAPDSPSYTYMGSPETYRRAGFTDVTPAGQDRRVMRFTIAAEYG